MWQTPGPQTKPVPKFILLFSVSPLLSPNSDHFQLLHQEEKERWRKPFYQSQVKKKSRTDSSSWTSYFSLSGFETSPDCWSGKEKAWLICLSAEAVLPPQRWPEEAWLRAKDAFLGSLGRQWNRHHSFSWNPPIHENIVTVGSAGDSRLNCDPSLALDQCEVCMIKHKADEMPH